MPVCGKGCRPVKAMSWQAYNAIDQIQIIKVDMPTPKANEVLIRTHASSINSWDWEIIQGTPWVNRVERALTSHYDILGADVAGTVAAVGRAVSRFKEGGEVYGDLSGGHWGGFAEYVTADQNALLPKPVNLTFAQAAAVPQAGLLALQGLRDKGRIRTGERVLINGASGGVGTFAIQLARLWHAEITAVCSGRKMELVRELGAAHVIDYTQQDFTQNGSQYDLILDVQGHHSIADYQRALSSNGRYVMVGGESALVNRVVWQGWLAAVNGGQAMGLLLHKANRGLVDLSKLLEQGKIVPIVDRCYPLEKLADAMRYYAEGHVRGKLVISMVRE